MPAVFSMIPGAGFGAGDAGHQSFDQIAHIERADGFVGVIQDPVAQGGVATGCGDEAFEVIIGLHIAGKLPLG